MTLDQSANGARTKFEEMRAAAGRRPHGTRARYIAGCRCLPCRAANSRYSVGREAARRAGDTRDLVPAQAAKDHISRLSKLGVGYKTIASAAGLAFSTVGKIRSGLRKQIRKDAERRILAVNESAKAPHAYVSAAESWKLLEELIERGYSKRQLAEWLGYKAQAIQFRRDRILVSSADRIQRLFDEVNAGKRRRA